MMVVQPLVLPQRVVQVLARLDAAGAHVGDAPFEAFDHLVGLGPLGQEQAMLDPALGTQPIEAVTPRRLALASRGKAVRELLPLSVTRCVIRKGAFSMSFFRKLLAASALLMRRNSG